LNFEDGIRARGAGLRVQRSERCEKRFIFAASLSGEQQKERERDRRPENQILQKHKVNGEKTRKERKKRTSLDKGGRPPCRQGLPVVARSDRDELKPQNRGKSVRVAGVDGSVSGNRY